MNDQDSPITEDELHAYVDGELPADRRGAVEGWLASHPEDAARVAAWRAQAEAIRARYGAVAAGFCVFMLTRRSIFAGVVGGEAVMLAGKWWLG